MFVHLCPSVCLLVYLFLSSVTVSVTRSSVICSTYCGHTVLTGQAYHHNHLLIILCYKWRCGGDVWFINLNWRMILLYEARLSFVVASASEAWLLAVSLSWLKVPKWSELVLTDSCCVWSVFIKGWQRVTKEKALLLMKTSETVEGGGKSSYFSTVTHESSDRQPPNFLHIKAPLTHYHCQGPSHEPTTCKTTISSKCKCISNDFSLHVFSMYNLFCTQGQPCVDQMSHLYHASGGFNRLPHMFPLPLVFD